MKTVMTVIPVSYTHLDVYKRQAFMDRVVLIGKDGKDEITVEELSKLSGRFNYEFVCCLGKRIPRVYTGGDFDLMK